MKEIFFILGILWGMLLGWFLIVYFSKTIFNLSDKTVTLFMNIGSLIIIAMVVAFYIGSILAK